MHLMRIDKRCCTSSPKFRATFSGRVESDLSVKECTHLGGSQYV